MSKTEQGTMPRRAYSYIRFSRKIQEKGDSMRRQADFALRIAEKEGWHLDTSLELHDKGVSGFRGKNRTEGALGEFLSLVQCGRISKGSILIVESLDRLTRQSMRKASNLFNGILDAGVSIQTMNPERFYNCEDEDGLLAGLEMAMIAYRAHEESQTKSVRMREAWETRRRNAAQGNAPRNGRLPAWFRVTPQGPEPIPERVAVVQEIYRLAINGYGVFRIGEMLRQQGVMPFGPRGTWGQSTLMFLLRTRTTVGEYQPTTMQHGEKRTLRMKTGNPIPGYYPACVDEETWQQAQRAISGRKKASGRPAKQEGCLFSGLMFDAVTGAKVSLRTNEVDGTRYPYAFPYAAGSVATLPGTMTWRYDYLETALLAMLGELAVRDLATDPHLVTETETEIAQLTERIISLATREQDISSMLSSLETPADHLPVLMRSLTTIQTDRKTTAERLRVLKETVNSGTGDNLGEIQGILRLLRSAQGDEQVQEMRTRFRCRVRSLVKEIWIRPERISRHSTVLHVQLWFTSGVRRDLVVLPPTWRDGMQHADHSGTDFRLMSQR